MRRSPWYAGGLAFACTRCGDCCRRPGEVRFSPDGADAVARRLLGPSADRASLTPELWTEDYDGALCVDVAEGESCPFLGDGGCTIHDLKPVHCRTYPFWPEVLERRALWRNERRYCEGIGEGSPYPLEAIERVLAERTATRENNPRPPHASDTHER